MVGDENWAICTFSVMLHFMLIIATSGNRHTGLFLGDQTLPSLGLSIIKPQFIVVKLTENPNRCCHHPGEKL